jgi:hypothetical protein
MDHLMTIATKKVRRRRKGCAVTPVMLLSSLILYFLNSHVNKKGDDDSESDAKRGSATATKREKRLCQHSCHASVIADSCC